MSSTSQKHRNFVNEPMGEKKVTVVPGIGKVLGRRLANDGYGKANNVYGQFLVQNKNKNEFKSWMKDACGANAKQQNDCYKSLKEFSGTHL